MFYVGYECNVKILKDIFILYDKNHSFEKKSKLKKGHLIKNEGK
jgi:hypothetical protein